MRILVSEMNTLKDKMEKMEQTHKETVNYLISKNEELERRVNSVEQFQRNRNSKDEFVYASSSENILNKSSVAEQGPFEKRMKSLGHGIYSGRKIRSVDPGSVSGKKRKEISEVNRQTTLFNWVELIKFNTEIR